ncbi:MAG: hypothetical protein LBQ39_01945 [Tannerellaceae bacterium]|nr:hypothetical protein [Tannerellaceae bacterium]
MHFFFADFEGGNFPVRLGKFSCTGKFLYLYGPVNFPVQGNFEYKVTGSFSFGTDGGRRGFPGSSRPDGTAARGWGRRHICAGSRGRPDGGRRGRRGLYSARRAQKMALSGVKMALYANFGGFGECS